MELKYRPLLTDLANDHKQVKFVNFCISYPGIFGNSSHLFLKRRIEGGNDSRDHNFIISELSTIIIRSTYYIFCLRNKTWSDTELLDY